MTVTDVAGVMIALGMFIIAIITLCNDVHNKRPRGKR